MLKKLFALLNSQKSESQTPSKTKNGITVVVKKKRKEEKQWTFVKEVTTDGDSEYMALCEVAYQIAGSENPRINQASTPFSATVVNRKQGFSYRFEIKRQGFN